MTKDEILEHINWWRKEMKEAVSKVCGGGHSGYSFFIKYTVDLLLEGDDKSSSLMRELLAWESRKCNCPGVFVRPDNEETEEKSSIVDRYMGIHYEIDKKISEKLEEKLAEKRKQREQRKRTEKQLEAYRKAWEGLRGRIMFDTALGTKYKHLPMNYEKTQGMIDEALIIYGIMNDLEKTFCD